jgi:cytochrome b
VYGSEGTKLSWWQFFLTISGMVAVINSVLAGTFIGLVIFRFIALSLALSALMGALGFLVILVFFLRYQWTRWGDAQKRLKTLFPRPLQ